MNKFLVLTLSLLIGGLGCYANTMQDTIIVVNNAKKVTIGNDCYIGMGVCIMYTGDIGDGSVVGAGSTVVKPIEPYSVAVGCPARVIKKRGK